MKYKNNHLKKILVVLISALLVFATVLSGCSTSSQSVSGKASLKGASSENLSDLNYVSLDEGFTNVTVKDEKSAMDAVASVADILGIEDVEKELKICDVNTVDGDSFYRFQQYYNDIPVYGKTVVVAADEVGVAIALTSNTVTIDSSVNDFEPSITQEEAEESVEKYAKKYIEESDDINFDIPDINNCQLYIFESDDSTYHIAYLLESNFYYFLIDSQSAEILDYGMTISDDKSTICFNGDGTKSFDGYYLDSDKKFCSYNEERNMYVYSYKGTNSHSKLFCKQEFLTSDDAYFGNTDTEEKYKYGDCAEYVNNVSDIYDFYYRYFNEKPYEKYHIFLDDGYYDGKNATGGYSYDSNGNKAGYMSMGYVTGVNDIDVMAHEYTHIVSMSIVNYGSGKEAGAINEGISDLFGEIIEGNINQTTPDWIMRGDNISVTRNIASPSSTNYPENVNEKNNSREDYSHAYSTIISHAGYLMWNGIDGSDSEKIDSETLAKIWYKALYLMQSDITFTQCANAVYKAAKTVEGINDSQMDCIQEAFERVGINVDTSSVVRTVNGAKLIVNDVNSQPYENYHLKISEVATMKNGSLVFSTKVNTLLDQDISDAKGFTIDLNEGRYIFTINDNDPNGSQQTYKYTVNVITLPKRTSFYDVIIDTNFGHTAIDDYDIPGDLTLTIGELNVIEPETIPNDATGYSLKWTSSDESVATVSPTGENGIITAKAKGTATITAELTSNGKTITKTTDVRVASQGRDTVLVLDVSGSMDGTPLDEMKESAIQFCNDLLEDEYNNRVGLVFYDNYIETVDLTNDVDALVDYIENVDSGATTNMEGGLSAAGDMLNSQGKDGNIKNIVIMADGLPNEGAVSSSGSMPDTSYSSYNSDSEYASAVIDTANSLMKNYNLYSLGFFHSLYGEEKDFAVTLMKKLTNMQDGYHQVDEAENLQFAFGDIQETISDGSKIVINIACPVDVNVTYNGETLSSAANTYSDKASFGTLQLLGTNKDIKVLSLNPGIDYDIKLLGTDTGTMDYSVNYIDDTENIIDYRSFESIPITSTTVIDSNTNNAEEVTLNIDEDGDGKIDLIWSASPNSSATLTFGETQTEPEEIPEPAVSNDNDSWKIVLVSVIVVLVFIAVIMIVVFLVSSGKRKNNQIEIPIVNNPPKNNDSELDEKLPEISTKYAVVISTGSMSGTRFELDNEDSFCIGKGNDPSQINLSSDYSSVSRQHCMVICNSEEDCYYVTDCSMNGTYFRNGRKLSKNVPTKVTHGTTLQLANSNCEVLFE